MGLPTQPVTLTVEQVDSLNRRLSTLRHDINNHLSLIVAAAELIKFKPDLSKRMCEKLAEQPSKIAEALQQFSVDLEALLGITRG